jgi:NAD(P)-dependent dehydrogenase (short-subunit alcohol dehydrogenase family)
VNDVTAASDEPDLAGQRILVTGASRGIGLAIAHRCATAGAHVVLVARDRAALRVAEESLAGGPHDAIALDVADATSWAEAAPEHGLDTDLDGLVTAAGVLGPIGRVGTWNVLEFERTLAINVTGTLLAITTCLPALERSSGGIVTLSGGGATSPLPRFDAYAASKAAVVRLTENIAVGIAESGVRVNSIAPGFIVTDMHNATIAAGPEAVGQEYFDRTVRAVESGGGDSPQFAADLAAFLLSDRSSGITGRLLSARWDPWRDEAFLERLRTDSDFCTLRRIDAQFFDRAAHS